MSRPANVLLRSCTLAMTAMCVIAALVLGSAGSAAAASQACYGDAPHADCGSTDTTTAAYRYDSCEPVAAMPPANTWDVRCGDDDARTLLGAGARGDSLRHAAKPVTGGAGPVLKGQAGVRSSIDEAVARGERLRGIGRVEGAAPAPCERRAVEPDGRGPHARRVPSAVPGWSGL